MNTAEQYAAKLEEIAEFRTIIAANTLREIAAFVRTRGVPAGWKMVPAVPTDEMLDAGFEDIANEHRAGLFGECPGHTWGDARACYRAMLAAAPPPPDNACYTAPTPDK